MQAQYSPDGGSTWVSVGGVITPAGNDYYGITSNTNPTGVEVKPQGIAAANDNPNFECCALSALTIRGSSSVTATDWIQPCTASIPASMAPLTPCRRSLSTTPTACVNLRR